MKWNIGLAAIVCATSGCVGVTSESVQSGDLLDASFALTWEINDAVSGEPLTCNAARADNVSVRTRNLSTGESFIDLFRCRARSGTTDHLTAGDYEVSVSLLDCFDDRSCIRPDVISTQSLPTVYGVWSDQDIDLGHFVFLVD